MWTVHPIVVHYFVTNSLMIVLENVENLIKRSDFIDNAPMPMPQPRKKHDVSAMKTASSITLVRNILAREGSGFCCFIYGVWSQSQLELAARSTTYEQFVRASVAFCVYLGSTMSFDNRSVPSWN